MSVIAVSLTLLALVTAGTTAVVWHHLDHNIDTLAPVTGPRPANVKVAGGEPLDLLLMGSDSRDCPGCAVDRLTGDGQRSDTTVLLHVSADRTHAYGVSIPRDLLVDRPACRSTSGTTVPAATQVEWNGAFGIGGAPCTVRQVESMTGIRIENYAVVDFGGFKKMVAALGGVEVCLPQRVDDARRGIHLAAGTRRMGPQEAEDYIRVRHGISLGTDTGRVKRQQAFMASMVDQVLSAGTLAHPRRLYRFLDAVTSSIGLDPDLQGLSSVVSLAEQMRPIGSSGVRFLTMPSHEDAAHYGRIVTTQPDADRLWSLLRRDRAVPARLSAGSISAAAVPGSGRRDRGPGAATKADLAAAGLCG